MSNKIATAEDDKQNVDVNMIQSLERGIIGLELAINRGAIRPAELAEKLGINRSSAYRLLYTLERMGYLLQDKDTRKFSPNTKKFRTLFNTSSSWIDIARQYLVQLCAETHSSAHIGVLRGNSVMYAAQEHSDNIVRIHTPPGTRCPIHASALGKAMLAFIDEQARENLIESLDFEQYASNSITNAVKLRENLSQIRQVGYAIDDEEYEDGARCIAAPIFDNNNLVIAAIGISGSSSQITLQRLPELSKCVLQASDNVYNAIKDINSI